MKRIVLFYLLGRPQALIHAFQLAPYEGSVALISRPASQTTRNMQRKQIQTVAHLWPLAVNSAPKIDPRAKTKSISEQEEYELAEEDFLLAKVKPKVLNHGKFPPPF